MPANDPPPRLPDDDTRTWQCPVCRHWMATSTKLQKLLDTSDETTERLRDGYSLLLQENERLQQRLAAVSAIRDEQVGIIRGQAESMGLVRQETERLRAALTKAQHMMRVTEIGAHYDRCSQMDCPTCEAWINGDLVDCVDTTKAN